MSEAITAQMFPCPQGVMGRAVSGVGVALVLAFAGIIPAVSAQGMPQDSGPPAVRMPRNPALDRHVQRARELLRRGDAVGGLEVLQAVLGGEMFGESGDGSASDPGAPGLDQAVFSGDDRLFRPVRRLCEETLSRLSPEVLTLYMERYGPAAEAAWQQVSTSRDLAALRRVGDRWFAIPAGAVAMEREAIIAMDQGAFPVAAQVLQRLLRVVPGAVRRRAGLDEPALWVRLALCWHLQGEVARAQQVLAELRRSTDGAVNVLGRVVPLEELADHPLFAGDRAHGGDPVAVAGTLPEPAPLPDLYREDPTPLWVYRHADAAPYRVTRAGARRPGAPLRGWSKGIGDNALSLGVASPGTRIEPVAGPDGWPIALLLRDHNRLRELDPWTGMLLAEGSGALLPPEPLGRGVRQRTPIYDHATQDVLVDDGRWFTVRAAPRDHPMGAAALLANQLVALQSTGGGAIEEVWSYPRVQELIPSEPLVPVPLATPKAAGFRLVFPTMAEGHLGLGCVHSQDGRLLWHTRLHTGGSPFVRPPATAVCLEGGRAFVLTQAGVAAAVDVDTGALLWARVHERTGTAPVIGGVPARQGQSGVPMGFIPVPPRLVAGRLILAPSDGLAILALDPATGELLWSLDARSGRVSRSESPLYPVVDHWLGVRDDALLLQAGRGVLCVDAATGDRRWYRPPPTGIPGSWWTGRGLVTHNQVLIPSPDRSVRVLPLDEQGEPAGEWRIIRLPDPAPGTTPLRGPCNLQLLPGQLLLCFANGVECHGIGDGWWSDVVADARNNPMPAAERLLVAGQLDAALDLLTTAMRAKGSVESASRDAAELARQAVQVARDLAIEAAARGDREAVLRPLGRAAEALASWEGEPEMTQRLILARVEAFQTLGDHTAAAEAREALQQALAQGATPTKGASR